MFIGLLYTGTQMNLAPPWHILVYTELHMHSIIPTSILARHCGQWPISGLHSIMMEKLSQAGEGGGVHALPLSLYLPSRTVQVAVYAPVERADTPPSLSSLPLYVLSGKNYSKQRRPLMLSVLIRILKEIQRTRGFLDILWFDLAPPPPPFSRPFHSHVKNSGFLFFENIVEISWSHWKIKRKIYLLYILY